MDVMEPGLLERHPWVARRKIHVDEYLRMGTAGILRDDERVELIEGEIVAMAPIGPDHAGTASFLMHALILAADKRMIVSAQNPVRLGRFNMPQPDIAVLRRRDDFYRRAHPQPGDVLLLVEVALSSLVYDRKVKLPLYAQHGIPEVWIVNLEAEIVECHRTPLKEAFLDVSRAVRGDTIAPALLPDVRIAVSDLLG